MFIAIMTVLVGEVFYLAKEKIPYLVVGRGSNLLVSDDGFKGVALILQEELANVEPNGKSDKVVVAGGGLALFELLDYCKRKGLGGLEFLAGIPGTAGGAVAMNAGAWGSDVARGDHTAWSAFSASSASRPASTPTLGASLFFVMFRQRSATSSNRENPSASDSAWRSSTRPRTVRFTRTLRWVARRVTGDSGDFETSSGNCRFVGRRISSRR